MSEFYLEPINLLELFDEVADPIDPIDLLELFNEVDNNGQYVG